MVLPNRAVPDLEDLDDTEFAELWDLVRTSVATLKATLRCDGVNVGINLGRPAGGSQAEHLHVHCVPRWVGDANFMAYTLATSATGDTLQLDLQNLRVPLAYVEFDNSRAVVGTPAMQYRVLFIGQKVAAGTATVNTLLRVATTDAAVVLFGAGSMLTRMIEQFKASNRYIDCWAIALADHASGAAAAGARGNGSSRMRWPISRMCASRSSAAMSGSKRYWPASPPTPMRWRVMPRSARKPDWCPSSNPKC